MKKNKINNFIIVICTMIILQGCGTFNKVFKTSTKEKEKSEVIITKEHSKTLEDKTNIIIHEKVDTIIHTKPINYTTFKPVINLKDIRDLIILDNDLTTIKQNYDTLSNTLKTDVFLKSNPIKVVIDKTTEINKDVKEIINSKLDSIDKKTNITKITTKHKEPSSEIFWTSLFTVGVLAVIYYLSKKFIEKKLL